MGELSLILQTGPTKQPISLKETKLHLRVDEDLTEDDALIRSLIVAATEKAQNITRRQFITATYELRLDSFPDVIECPRPPLQSVGFIKYKDTDNVEQTLSTDIYNVDPYSTIGRILTKKGESWPSTYGDINDVVIRYIAGYGDPDAVPDAIKAAIKLIVGHLYEHREDALVGVSGSELPQGAEDLLYPYRILGEW